MRISKSFLSIPLLAAAVAAQSGGTGVSNKPSTTTPNSSSSPPQPKNDNTPSSIGFSLSRTTQTLPPLTATDNASAVFSQLSSSGVAEISSFAKNVKDGVPATMMEEATVRISLLYAPIVTEKDYMSAATSAYGYVTKFISAWEANFQDLKSVTNKLPDNAASSFIGGRAENMKRQALMLAMPVAVMAGAVGMATLF